MPSAFIPLPAPVAMPDAPSVSTGIVRAPTMDTRGLLAGVADLAGAGRQSMIPLEPFMAPGRGLQQLGAGIKEGVDPLYKLGMARLEAQNDLDVAGAQNMLAVKFAEFEGRMQSMPPKQWQEAFQPIGEQAVTEALQDERLSPSARRRIELYGKRWLSDAAVRVMTAATVETGKRAEAETFANLGRSLMVHDIPAAERQLAEIKASGKPYIDLRRIVQAEADIIQAKKDARMNVEYDSIHLDPKAWKAKNAKRPTDMDADVYDRLVNDADSTIHQNMSALADDLTNAISSGQIQSPAGVEKWAKDKPDVTPHMVELAQAHVLRMRDATARQNMMDHGIEIASRLRSEAKIYDPKKDSYEKYLSLRLRIGELPAGIEGDVSQILEVKNPDRIAAMKPAATLTELGDNILHSMLVDGDFGSFDNGTGVDQKGLPVAKPGESPEEVYKRNQRQFQDALVRKSRVSREFEVWLKANPQSSAEQVQKKIYELLPAGTRARALDRRDRASEKSPVDNADKTTAGSGDNIDLPGGSGAPTGPGILPAPGETPPESSPSVWVSDKKRSMEVVPMAAADIERWMSAGDKPSEVWDSKDGKFVTIPASKLIPGRHYMPSSFLTP